MEEMTFRNLLVVKSHLNSIGYRVSKSTLYEHAKARKIKPRENGLFYITDVEQYARDYLKQKNEPIKNSSDTVQRRRNEAEARKLEAQAHHWEIKAKVEAGDYVPREEFERALAQRASFLKTDLESFFRSQADKICHKIKGDNSLIPKLVDFMLENLAIFLDRYAQPREFKVPAPLNAKKDDFGSIEGDDHENNADILDNNSTNEYC